MYVMPRVIHDASGNRRLWYKDRFPGSHSYSESFIEVNCTEGTTRSLQVAMLDDFGIGRSDAKPRGWVRVVPDSAFYAVVTYACSH